MRNDVAGRSERSPPEDALLYDYLLRIHLLRHLGQAQMGKIDPATIRRWRGAASAGKHGSVTIAKAYRLLRQIMQAAVAGLRRGECFALRRRNLIENDGTWSVVVDASVVFVKGEARHQPLKTSAGVRRLTLPSVLSVAVEEHLATCDPFKAEWRG